MLLKNKVAIVTGASRGIGAQIALALAQQGCRVVIAARTINKKKLPGTLGETLNNIEAIGGKAIAVQTDVTNYDDLKALVLTTIETYGQLDIVINNAADTQAETSLIENHSQDGWLRQFNTNIHAPFFLMSLAVPYLKKQNGGVIINMTSAAADLVEPGAVGAITETGGNIGSMFGYATTKAALNRLSNALASELTEHNIAVVCLDPGYTRTELVDALAAKGFVDADKAHAMGLPVAKVIQILTAEKPMGYSGCIVRIG